MDLSREERWVLIRVWIFNRFVVHLFCRGYYRCSSSKGCLARKQVECSHNDPSMLIISYSAEHNHPWPSHRNSLAGSTRVTSSASKLAKGESAADQVACTRSSAATLEKQKILIEHDNTTES